MIVLYWFMLCFSRRIPCPFLPFGFLPPPSTLLSLHFSSFSVEINLFQEGMKLDGNSFVERHRLNN